jgi:MurNAc alpha-1-phosphate uridylyltransferase
MTTPFPILLFAAGKGTRMRHLATDRPKPLVPVAGRPLLDHALRHATPELAAPRVVNLHTRGQMIRDWVSDPDVIYSDESQALLETGGGLKKAVPLLGAGPVFTMNTDTIFAGPNPLDVLARAWRPEMGALLLCVETARAAGHLGRGDFDHHHDGRITRGHAAIYTGVQIIDPTVLDRIDQTAFSMNVAWDILAREERLFGTPYPGRWCDVGQPESIPLAEALIAETADV